MPSLRAAVLGAEVLAAAVPWLHAADFDTLCEQLLFEAAAAVQAVLVAEVPPLADVEVAAPPMAVFCAQQEWLAVEGQATLAPVQCGAAVVDCALAAEEIIRPPTNMPQTIKNFVNIFIVL